MKKFILSVIVFCFSFLANCQLDSVSVAINFYPVTDTVYTNPNYKELKVNVWVNDFDFFGEVIVDIIDGESESPLAKVKLDKQTIENQNIIQNGIITVPIGVLDSSESLIIKTTVRNFQFLDLPQVVTTYSLSN